MSKRKAHLDRAITEYEYLRAQLGSTGPTDTVLITRILDILVSVAIDIRAIREMMEDGRPMP